MASAFTQQELNAMPKAMREKVLQMEAEKDALESAGQGKFTARVGSKGGISISGFGQFPFSPYREQLERFLDWLVGDNEISGDVGVNILRTFMQVNADKLKTKAQSLVDKAAPATVAGNNSK